MRTRGGREISWLTVGVAAAAAFFVGVVLVVALRGFEAEQPAAAGAGSTPARTTRVAPPRPVTPDLTGMPLDVAESVLADAGLDAEVDRGGGAFGVVVKSNWRVVEQAPAPGAAQPLDGEPVRVAIERG